MCVLWLCVRECAGLCLYCGGSTHPLTLLSLTSHNPCLCRHLSHMHLTLLVFRVFILCLSHSFVNLKCSGWWPDDPVDYPTAQSCLSLHPDKMMGSQECTSVLLSLNSSFMSYGRCVCFVV